MVNPQEWWDQLNRDISVAQAKLRADMRVDANPWQLRPVQSLNSMQEQRTARIQREVAGKFWPTVEIEFCKIDPALLDIFGINSTREQTFMQRRADIKARLAQLEREYAALERFPDDNFADGTVVTFDRVTDVGEDDERKWSFAAMKFGKVWYLTAQRGKVVLWEDLCQIAGDSEITLMVKGEVVVSSKEGFDASRAAIAAADSK